MPGIRAIGPCGPSLPADPEISADPNQALRSANSPLHCQPGMTDWPLASRPKPSRRGGGLDDHRTEAGPGPLRGQGTPGALDRARPRGPILGRLARRGRLGEARAVPAGRGRRARTDPQSLYVHARLTDLIAPIVAGTMAPDRV